MFHTSSACICPRGTATRVQDASCDGDACHESSLELDLVDAFDVDRLAVNVPEVVLTGELS